MLHLHRITCALVFATTLSAQVVPDAIYYRFNEGGGPTTLNAALPGVGNLNAPVTPGLTFAPGIFGTCIAGTGTVGSNSNVDTGYLLNLQGQSWTLEFWINPNPATSTVQYIIGVPTGGSFRIYTSAVPGSGNITLTGSGLSTTIASGAVPTPGVWSHVAYVFDNSVSPPTVTPYVNAVPGNPVNQTGSLNLTSTVSLLVGSQLTGSAGLNGFMDEFRLWTTARTASEIAASYNTELYPNNILTAITSGGGAGDLFLSLTAISPNATEGFILISTLTSMPMGSGPVFGIYPDALTWSIISSPAQVGNPLHFPIGFTGVFPDQALVLPPGALSSLAGQTWDLVAVVLGGGFSYLGKSSVQRLAW